MGNNRLHRLVCAKTISSWVRKVIFIANVHISLGSLQGAVTSAALVAGISLVSILQVGDWARVSTPARHYFSPISLLQIGTRILYSVLYWASVSRCFTGK